MKVPLEPIPTEQIVIVKQRPPKSGLLAPEGTRAMGSMGNLGGGFAVENTQSGTSQLEKAYPWLLGASTCLSALLCWMYVTKPVIVQETLPTEEPVKQELVANNPVESLANESPEDLNKNELLPSDSQLPSSTDKSVATNQAVALQADGSKTAESRMVKAPDMGSGDPDGDTMAGWEKTNLKVQHIISADTGNGENEKIVINVPVLYETRSMRWTPEKIEKARDVLARLMLYERNLSNLRNEGAGILSDWNQIIRETVPAGSLRADSPSLPYNNSLSDGTKSLPESSAVIQVEDQ